MYTLERKVMFTSHGSRLSPSWMVQDAFTQEEKGLKILERYLCEGSTVLAKEVMTIADLDRSFTKQDSDRLQAMFVLLLDARRAWQEDSTSLKTRKAQAQS